MINATQSIVISIIEKQPHVCQGIAYRTSSPYHPLNVRADKMGIFANQPDHFYSWIEANQDMWRNRDPIFHSLNISPTHFLPRRLYAIYLQHMFEEIQTLVKSKNVTCNVIHDTAYDANIRDEGIEILLKKNSSLSVDKMVLATGIPSHQTLPFETSSLLNDPRYISNVWDPHVEHVLHNLFAGSKGIGKKIVIIGSGLTAIDVLFTMHSLHYQGRFHFISKHGIFPEVHPGHLLPAHADFRLEDLPSRLSDLIHFFKQQLEQCKEKEWMQVVDAFRHCTQAFWQALPLPTKKRFMRHLFFLWNKHRHRMSPQSYDLVRLYENSQALTLTAGLIQEVTPLSHEALRIKYISRETTELKEEEVDCVINCTGPDYRIMHHPDSLIQSLLKKQVILPDELQLGLKVLQKEKLAGKGEGKVYALGTLLFGELLETSAVPELRIQAQSIAQDIKRTKG